MNILIKTDDVCNIISTIAMCASDNTIDNAKRIAYCHDEIFRLTHNEEIATHAADCITAIITKES